MSVAHALVFNKEALQAALDRYAADGTAILKSERVRDVDGFMNILRSPALAALFVKRPGDQTGMEVL